MNTAMHPHITMIPYAVSVVHFSRTLPGESIKMKLKASAKAKSEVKTAQIRNLWKKKRLRLPMQVPVRGQWWSCISTHTWHVEQWNERGGLMISHVLQYERAYRPSLPLPGTTT